MRLLISILVFILALVVACLFGVFVAWDFDLSNWSPQGRFGLAAFGLIFAVTSTLIVWKAME